MSEQQIGPQGPQQWVAGEPWPHVKAPDGLDNHFISGEGGRLSTTGDQWRAKQAEVFQAEAIATADAIRKLARKVADASWALDSALSAQRKAGTGYREGPSGDSGQGGGTYRHGGRSLEQSVRDAQSILAARGRA